MNLSDIDLNQLVVFQQLMLERRVSKVAEKLGITQPAVSNTLAKLRRKLGDELFIRTPAGMVPTVLAEQMAAPIGNALQLIEAGLNAQTAFVPATAQRALTIGMTDIGEVVFLPRLLARLHEQAPQITLSTVRSSPSNLREEMEKGLMDLAIGPMSHLSAGFFQRKLFRQRYVCLFRRGHVLDKQKISLTAIQKAEHLIVESAGTVHGRVDELLRDAGIVRNVRLTIPHFVSVGHILRSSDLVATVTETLAKSLVEPFDLHYLPHPFKLPEVDINTYWHARVHRSPLHQWLRSTVYELFADDARAPEHEVA